MTNIDGKRPTCSTKTALPGLAHTQQDEQKALPGLLGGPCAHSLALQAGAYTRAAQIDSCNAKPPFRNGLAVSCRIRLPDGASASGQLKLCQGRRTSALIDFRACAILSSASRRGLAPSPTCFRSKVVSRIGDVADNGKSSGRQLFLWTNKKSIMAILPNIDRRQIADLSANSSARWNWS
jgi:hypothetical protein